MASSAATSAWSTTSELTFISRLGEFSERPGNRKDLLQGYLTAMEKRRSWGSIEKDVVIGYAKRQLEIEEAWS